LIFGVGFRNSSRYQAAFTSARFVKRGDGFSALSLKITRFQDGDYFTGSHDLVFEERHLFDLRADFGGNVSPFARPNSAHCGELGGDLSFCSLNNLDADYRRYFCFSLGCRSLPAPDDQDDQRKRDQRYRCHNEHQVSLTDDSSAPRLRFFDTHRLGPRRFISNVVPVILHLPSTEPSLTVGLLPRSTTLAQTS